VYRQRWNAISARINGVSDAAYLLAQFLQVGASDSYGVQKRIGKECFQILTILKAFADEYEATIPNTMKRRIEEFYTQNAQLFEESEYSADAGARARASIVLLSSLCAELNFLVSDEQELLFSKTERAFLHLRQVIVANRREREVWIDALSSGEVACEKLGAAHLLWHGIYAFKVDAAGARTDLIAPELPDLKQIARSADGLILTEWKSVTSSNAREKFAQALNQARIYSQGALAGIELRKYRFLVGVSEKALPPEMVPSDVEERGVVYRHINIPVNPSSPSVQARRGSADLAR
jgi:hypothetical protein